MAVVGKSSLGTHGWRRAVWMAIALALVVALPVVAQRPPTPTRGVVTLRLGSNVRALAFTDDGQFLAYAAGSTLYVYRTRTWELTRSVEVGGSITDIAYSPNGRYLAAAVGSQVIIYETATWTRLSSVPRGGANVLSVTFSPRGEWLVFGTSWQDADIYVYSTSTWSRLAAFAASDSKNSVHFDAHQRYLGFTSTYKYYPKIRTAGGWDRVVTLTGGYSESARHTFWYDLRFSANGRWVAYGFLDTSRRERTLYIHQSLLDWPVVSSVRWGNATVRGSLDFSPDSQLLAHGAEDVRLFRVDPIAGQLRLVAILQVPKPVREHSLRFSKRGGWLAYSDGDNVYVRSVADLPQTICFDDWCLPRVPIWLVTALVLGAGIVAFVMFFKDGL